MVILEKRGAGKANERGVGQGQPHVAGELAGLGAVSLVGDNDDVIPGAVGMPGVNVLIELMDQAEDEAMVSFEQFLQFLARPGAGRLLVGKAAAHKGAEDLVIEVLAVGRDDEGEIAVDMAAYLLREHDHGVGLAAALRVPEHAEPAKVRVSALNDGQFAKGLFVDG